MEDSPVYVPEELLKANPKFRSLLTALVSRKIRPNGVSIKLHEDHEKAKLVMGKERERYLKQRITYSIVKDLIMQNSSKATPHAKVYEALDYLMVVAETKQHLHLPSECAARNGKTPSAGDEGDEPSEEGRLSLFGFTNEEFGQIALDSSNLIKDVPRIGQVVVRDVETEMEKRCLELTDFASTETHPVSASHACHLHTIIARRTAQLRNEKRMYGGEQVATSKAFWEYYKIMSKTLALVVEVTQKYTVSERFKQDEVYVKWLQTSCRCMLLKLSVLTNQILRDTYTPDKVQLLGKLRHRIEREMRDTKVELEESGVRLKQYESVGMGFKDLVAHYASLRNQLQNKQWAIAQLEKMQHQRESFQ